MILIIKNLIEEKDIPGHICWERQLQQIVLYVQYF